MSKRVMLTGLLVLSAALVGCVDETIELTVKGDGSGLLTRTVYLGKMLTSMGAAAAEGKPGGGPLAKMMDKDTLTEMGKALGEGVTLESVKPLKHADGREGFVAVYAFQDVNEMKVPTNPGMPAGGGMMPGGRRRRPGGPPKGKGAPGEKDKKSPPIVIRFTKGTPAKITITVPQPKDQPGKASKPPEPKKPKSPQAPPGGAESRQAMGEMVKMAFAEFRFCLRVKVDGTITKTNAKYVSKDKTTVTLIDMNVGKALGDPETAKKLEAAGGIKTVAQAKEKLKDIPHIQFEPAEKVEIEFQPK